MRCRMKEQGFPMGKCLTKLPDGSKKPACEATLKEIDGIFSRVITSAHLSRPEDYYSIYQSGCNHNCLKCHSWEFSKNFQGEWWTTEEIAAFCAEYERLITVWEPRNRALMFTASDLCRHCGMCVREGKRHPLCPNKLSPLQITLGPQGFGPARNIVAFTGGDIACVSDFYAQTTRKIKERCTNMHVLLETNGYGLTPSNLDLLADAGLDSYWLDVKAYDEDCYKKLCGTTNKWILELPGEIKDRGFELEILSLFIPNWVELDQLEKIFHLVAQVDVNIPFTILAFFPQYKLRDTRRPTMLEMLQAYYLAKDIGLKRIRVGNLGVFLKTESDIKLFTSLLEPNALG
ncbi:MAG: radical SAM protein [Candidatus Helarchaeota archaeon]|nr:radical SAM protein [Candidatus Helarchaeota archaeon]